MPSSTFLPHSDPTTATKLQFLSPRTIETIPRTLVYSFSFLSSVRTTAFGICLGWWKYTGLHQRRVWDEDHYCYHYEAAATAAASGFRIKTTTIVIIKLQLRL
ncbi:predicted protein [Pyrenophora tritici-repentis Pt-1C-BFP]|uniref:Uncharacterized protein n=1 Tax=Pyrenophora tritici-repentis (strain Pt-1C-BFP) TaxID=426418 RepID=B2WCD8_PYRTR|nr:uncharacterized protein PTRG_07647 [Pyrenophora tritici-repentis Pt-1C-BFP]EDU50566.1 predicted protein [Pyrenophora tritici-repentis Pt-1C-BFP]